MEIPQYYSGLDDDVIFVCVDLVMTKNDICKVRQSRVRDKCDQTRMNETYLKYFIEVKVVEHKVTRAREIRRAVSDTGETDAFAFEARQLEYELTLILVMRLENGKRSASECPTPVCETGTTGIGRDSNREELLVERVRAYRKDVTFSDLHRNSTGHCCRRRMYAGMSVERMEKRGEMEAFYIPPIPARFYTE